MGKKKKGCVTLMILVGLFVTAGCVENKITNSEIEAGDNIESPRVESPDNGEGGTF